MRKDSFLLQGNHSPGKKAERERVLQWTWANYFRKGVEESRIRSIVLESWKRSASHSISPFLTSAPVVLEEYETERRKDANRAVLTFVRPFMEDLYEIVKGTNSIIAFSDNEGVVLEMYGDADIKANAASTNFMVGVNMKESVMGTNSIGTSLILEQPVQMIGAEHYCQAWHTSHCSTAPIRDPQTEAIIGTFTLIGYLKSAHPHSLALVKTAAETLAQLLRQQGLKHEQYMINSYFSAAMESISDGIVVLNKSGEVIRHNQIASHLLKLPSSITAEKGRIDLLPHLETLRPNFQKAMEGEEIVVQKQLDLPGNTQVHLLVTSRKITVSGTHIGSILILKKVARDRTRVMTARHTFSSLIGEEESFSEAVTFAKKAALVDKSVLLTGESGTGKELFAQSIHNGSIRRTEPFIAVNCSAIPKELITSELFGYVEGAFTNAVRGGKKGKFEAADGGTLFLDEISDMPMDLQAHLLRVLEEKEVTPLGANEAKSVNVRIIAATNRNLFNLVEEGKFRLDLFYRLNVIAIEIPPLRKRKRDIGELARLFSSEKQIDNKVVDVFQTHDWPGNLREMKNVIEQMELFSEKETLTKSDLPSYLRGQVRSKETGEPTLYRSFSNQTKKESLIAALKENETVPGAAKNLGVSTSTVYRWAQAYGINVKNVRA